MNRVWDMVVDSASIEFVLKGPDVTEVIRTD